MKRKMDEEKEEERNEGRNKIGGILSPPLAAAP